MGKDIVLAIDDNPNRYWELSLRLRNYNIAVCCLQNPHGAEILLDSDRVLTVLLNHDLPSLIQDPYWDRCSELAPFTHKYDGRYFAKEILAPRKIPTIIVASVRPEAAALARIFHERGAPHTSISLANPEADREWLDFILGVRSAGV